MRPSQSQRRMMVYVKSALVGVLTALVAVAIVVAALLRISYSEGSGALFINIAEWQILAAALVGFAAGFWWTSRRLRRVDAHPTLR